MILDNQRRILDEYLALIVDGSARVNVIWDQDNGRNLSLVVKIDGTPFSFVLRPHGNYFSSFGVARTIYTRDFRTLETGVEGIENVRNRLALFLSEANQYLVDRGQSQISVPKISVPFSERVRGIWRFLKAPLTKWFSTLNNWWSRVGIWPQVVLIACAIIGIAAPIVARLVEDRQYDISIKLINATAKEVQLEVRALHQVCYLDDRGLTTIQIPFYNSADSISFLLRNTTSDIDSSYHFYLPTMPTRIQFETKIK